MLNVQSVFTYTPCKYSKKVFHHDKFASHRLSKLVEYFSELYDSFTQKEGRIYLIKVLVRLDFLSSKSSENRY